MESDLSTLQEVFLIVGPLAAALAAGASWLSVLQARRLAREARNPQLQIQAVTKADHTLGAIVLNAGNGAARGSIILLSNGKKYAANSLFHGFLRPGEMVEVQTAIPRVPDDPAPFILAICRDSDSFLHAWTNEEDHRVFRTRFLRRPRYGGRIGDTFGEMFPDVPHPKTQLQVEIEITPPSHGPLTGQ